MHNLIKYKLGLPYIISEAFYLDAIIAHYEELNKVATTQAHFKFINDRLTQLNLSLIKISN